MKSQIPDQSPVYVPFAEGGVERHFVYFKNLIQRQFPGLSATDDLVQETLIRIWSKKHLYDPNKSSFATWSTKICIYLCIDYLRKQKLKLVNLESGDDPRDTSLLVSMDAIGLLGLVNTLENGEREVIELAYYRGFTHQEIANLIHVPLGTVKTRIIRAIKKLRKYFPESLN